MAYELLLLIVLMTCSQITAHYLDGSVAPTNTAVPKGNRTELRCRPNSTSDVYSWVFQPAGTTEDAVIYSYGVGVNNNKMTSFYVRKLSDGSVDLIFNSTQLSDAGLYTCMIRVNITREGATAITQQTAQLIVLEKEPTCKTTSDVKENGWIEMQYIVSYRGNWAPMIKWRENGEAIIRDIVENVTVPNVTVTSTLRVLARNSANYTCMAYFNENIEIDYDASKTTINTCSWTSPLPQTLNTTAATSPLSNSYTLIALAIFAAAFSAVLVLLVMKMKVYRKDKNSVQSDEPLNENAYFEDVCQYEEVVDCGDEPLNENAYFEDVCQYEEVVDCGDDPLNENDYFEDVRQCEEVVDCEVTDAMQPSQSLQADQGFGKTPDFNDERRPATKKNLSRVQINGKTRFLGEDGTEYLDLNGLKEQRHNSASTEEPFYRASKYAIIDHNVKVSDMQP